MLMFCHIVGGHIKQLIIFILQSISRKFDGFLKVPLIYDQNKQCVCRSLWKFYSCSEAYNKEWLKVNNPFFVKFLHFDECPSPLVIEDEVSRIDESEDPNVEEQIEIQYWFPNNGDQNSSNLVFHS